MVSFQPDPVWWALATRANQRKSKFVRRILTDSELQTKVVPRRRPKERCHILATESAPDRPDMELVGWLATYLSMVEAIEDDPFSLLARKIDKRDLNPKELERPPKIDVSVQDPQRDPKLLRRMKGLGWPVFQHGEDIRFPVATFSEEAVGPLARVAKATPSVSLNQFGSFGLRIAAQELLQFIASAFVRNGVAPHDRRRAIAAFSRGLRSTLDPLVARERKWRADRFLEFLDGFLGEEQPWATKADRYLLIGRLLVISGLWSERERAGDLSRRVRDRLTVLARKCR